MEGRGGGGGVGGSKSSIYIYMYMYITNYKYHPSATEWGQYPNQTCMRVERPILGPEPKNATTLKSKA